MIFGQPFEFAVFYELLEKTDDEYWKYGVFIFFIEDEIYPAKGSNYTLSMAMDYLKDSYQEVIDSQDGGLDMSIADHVLLKTLAHSHGMLLDNDPEDLELPDSDKIGVFLSPLEIADTGFYLFYYACSNKAEYLIYSSDYGNTAKRAVLNKGTVSGILAQLPSKEAI
ncbi:immunity 42 family protein [Rosenbergiella metrosideri]|uniref:immunity 42 family protein n=1 Tax=Rosenbergiella metrosideri TaxID=2921185 RepID=UPI001F4FED48|nr:immunity 42 family protein [Rosenbergiella metrosideri]